MIRAFIIFLLALGACRLEAQPLTANPYFEDGVQPVSLGGIRFCQTYRKAYGTPDYFYEPPLGSAPGIPDNFFGWQEDILGGHAYAGFMAYSQVLPLEAIKVGLTDSMRTGRTYAIRFQYSLANKAAYTCNNLGYRVGGYEFSFPAFPTDTLGWIVHEDTLVIDNLPGFQSSDTLLFGQLRQDPAQVTPALVNQNGYAWAYFYVGEVTVVDITAPVGIPDPSAHIGNKVLEYVTDMQGRVLPKDYIRKPGEVVVEHWKDRAGRTYAKKTCVL